MSTCVGSAKYLRAITHQLGKLSIAGRGGRNFHSGTTGVNAVLKKNSLTRKPIVLKARLVSGQCSTGVSRTPLPTIAIVLRENKEIKEKHKPQITYDCPQISELDIEIDTPPSENSNIPVDNPVQKGKIEECPENSLPQIQLKQKMRNRRKNQHITIIRHIKMKRHQLRRTRKRLWPIKKKEKFLRKKKQDREFEAYLDQLRSYGTNFDAEKYVRDSLAIAKKAGYQFNVKPTVTMLKKHRKHSGEKP